MARIGGGIYEWWDGRGGGEARHHDPVNFKKWDYSDVKLKI
jgi:hypothetical protein